MTESPLQKHIAIVGSGIAGLACAHALARHGRHRVTLFEAGPYFGGHTNTVDVTLDGVTHPVDTGFLVFNERTYPNLIALFDELGVPTASSEMSFSVSLAGQLEWAGTSLASVFAQPKNLVNPRFLGMLRDILRFNREATAAATGAATSVSLGEYIERGCYGDAFRDWYLLPMAGAIWSCPTEAMMAYPFATFARFCHNHGLLQVANRPQWFTVRNGAREYVRRIVSRLDDARLNTPVRSVRRGAGAALVESGMGIERFDEVVLACHSDQSLDLIDGPTVQERSILSSVRYQANVAWLHTDTALLPRRKAAWAAWNYLARGIHTLDARSVAVTYLLNKLQPLPFTTPVMVTLNPFTEPDAAKVIERIEYAHPVFDGAAVAAQRRLPAIQGVDRLWYAGAWTGYGFHEDGFKSGQAMARALLQRDAQAAPLRAAA